MTKYRIPLRIVFYQDADGDWNARCLEFDLVGDGATREEAQAALETAINIQATEAIRHDNPANLFQPADGKYLRMFAEGNDIAVGQLEMQGPTFIVDQFEAREYLGDFSAV